MKRAYIITISVSAALLIGWVAIFALPAWEKRDFLKTELSNRDSQLNDYNDILTRFSATFKQFEQMLEKKNKILSRLYTKEDLVKLFSQLNRLAKVNGVEIVEISPSVDELIRMNRTIVKDGKPLELQLKIKMKGRLFNTSNFIRAIEKQDYYKGFQLCNIINQGVQDKRSFYNYSFIALLGTIKES